MKILFLSSMLVFSLSSFAKTINDPTCNIYLPITDELSSWGGWQQELIDKGYNPIEVKDIDLIPEKALVGSLGYSLSSDTSFGKSSSCKVEMSVQKVLNKAPITLSTLFTQMESQKRLTILDSKISCKNAENKIQRKIPSCVTI